MTGMTVGFIGLGNLGLRAEGFPEELVDKKPKNIGREL